MELLLDIVTVLAKAINRLLRRIGSYIPDSVVEAMPIDYLDALFPALIGALFGFQWAIDNAAISVSIIVVGTTILCALRQRYDYILREQHEEERISRSAEMDQVRSSLDKARRELEVVKCQRGHSRAETKQALTVSAWLTGLLDALDNIPEGSSENLSTVLSAFLNTLCSHLATYIRSEYHVDPYVTIYQSFIDDKGSYLWTMAGFDTAATSQPHTYYELYPFDDKSQLFIRIATLPDNDRIFCIASKNEIKDSFSFHSGCEQRERRICQYVGRPVCTARNTVPFVLQLDVEEEGALGATEQEMSKNLDTVFKIYANALVICYFVIMMVEGDWML